eukprot:GDKJ01015407.1.p1 GENE.GDKJ01015407.1~~GDKJ01015407.1.p1  ORF type:complete len:333 (-),score=46.69 GDKJ01015407.1:120-1118(-)
MKVIVTGGSGFIGSHLVERLLKDGNQVMCIDNLFCSDPCNTDLFKNNPNYTFIKQDVINPIEFEGVDRIYHLACPASPVHYQIDPIWTLKTLFLGTLNMLELAKKTGARILITSTSEVYGDPLVHPQQETYLGNVNCIGRRACYDEGKRCSETLTMDFHREHNVDIRIARIFNTYGPRMLFHDGRVVSNFIVQALKGTPLSIYGDGSQTRSFCYVADMVEGLTRLMENENGFIGPCNLGNPVEFTVKELAEMVIQQTGATAGIEYRALPSDDPTKRRPVCNRAQKELNNWTPNFPLSEGLRLTIADFKERAEKNPASLIFSHQKEAILCQKQ